MTKFIKSSVAAVLFASLSFSGLHAAKELKLPSGVVVSFEKVSKDGKKPLPTDSVTVHYEGKLTDGKVFDSSYKRGMPATFPLNRVISCWTEGVGMMSEGDVATLTCPSDTAYGDRGAPGSIPGGATLIFKVELLKIN